MSEIHVCALMRMPELASRLRAPYVISVVAPSDQPKTPEMIEPERHHRMAVHDIAEPMPEHVLPEYGHVCALIEFLRRADGAAPLVVHCLAGVSRSSAAALIALVLGVPGREEEAAALIRSASAYALPNRRIVALADEILGRRGALVDAVAAMAPADLSDLRGHFVLPRRLPA
jgi:predicted protein tyrosine phosphatase